MLLGSRGVCRWGVQTPGRCLPEAYPAEPAELSGQPDIHATGEPERRAGIPDAGRAGFWVP